MLSFAAVDAAPHHRACAVTFTFTTRMVQGGPTESGKEIKLLCTFKQTQLNFQEITKNGGNCEGSYLCNIIPLSVVFTLIFLKIVVLF